MDGATRRTFFGTLLSSDATVHTWQTIEHTYVSARKLALMYRIAGESMVSSRNKFSFNRFVLRHVALGCRSLGGTLVSREPSAFIKDMGDFVP